MQGVVVKKVADLFSVYSNGVCYNNVVARGGIKKKESRILVGDIVFFEHESKDKYIIESICERKNELVRPPLANLDNLIIVITQKPLPDLVLVDKLIIKCKFLHIRPILVISKADILQNDFINELKNQYKNVVKDILVLSSVSGEGKEDLLKLIQNQTSSLVGQSAVGKSSIINMLGGSAQVGELSKKSMRGKNTTRHSEILVFENNVRIADTSGFSRFVLDGIKYSQLMRYYDDFEKFSEKCKYSTCVHIPEIEDECNVKKALKSGKININRYNRYKAIYEELKSQWDRRYN